MIGGNRLTLTQAAHHLQTAFLICHHAMWGRAGLIFVLILCLPTIIAFGFACYVTAHQYLTRKQAVHQKRKLEHQKSKHQFFNGLSSNYSSTSSTFQNQANQGNSSTHHKLKPRLSLLSLRQPRLNPSSQHTQFYQTFAFANCLVD